jgi:hypothetical protein
MEVRLSALVMATLYPNPAERLRVLISVSGRVNLRTIMRVERLGKLKKINNNIGNQTRDLPSCSILPQPTLPQEAR